MSPPQNSGTVRQIDGRREMTELTLKTIIVLQQVDLEEEIDELQARVFARSKEELFEITQVGAYHWHWRFKPMVELLLCEVQEIGNDTTLSTDQQQRRIRWALDETGF